MYRIISFLIVLIPAMTSAQTEMGIKGGLNVADIVMTNYINPDVESDLGLKLGMHGGFFVNGMVNERVGMVAELLYSNKGVKANTSIHLHYITIPLLVQYRLTDNIFAEIGPEPGYLFSARSTHGNVSNTYNNKFDLALDAGFRLNTAKLVIGLRYCAGLFSVSEPTEKYGAPGNEKIKYQNRVLQLSLGYKFWEME